MIITLKNNKKVDLKWNFLVLEYLEDYKTDEGAGITQIQKDLKHNKNKIKITNHFIYAIIRANMDEPLTYQEAVRLVEFKDYQKIVDFIDNNLGELDEFKKKGRNYTQVQKKKKKK